MLSDINNPYFDFCDGSPAVVIRADNKTGDIYMGNYNNEVKNALRVIKAQCVNNVPPEGDCRSCSLYGYCGTEPYSWNVNTVDLKLVCPHTKHCSTVVLAETTRDEALRKLRRQIAENEVLREQRDCLEHTLDTLCPDWKLKISKDKAGD